MSKVRGTVTEWRTAAHLHMAAKRSATCTTRGNPVKYSSARQQHTNFARHSSGPPKGKSQHLRRRCVGEEEGHRSPDLERPVGVGIRADHPVVKVTPRLEPLGYKPWRGPARRFPGSVGCHTSPGCQWMGKRFRAHRSNRTDRKAETPTGTREPNGDRVRDLPKRARELPAPSAGESLQRLFRKAPRTGPTESVDVAAKATGSTESLAAGEVDSAR